MLTETVSTATHIAVVRIQDNKEYLLSLLPDFVSMYVDHVLNTSIAEQFSAFYEGFHSVCNSAALKVNRHNNSVGVFSIE